LSATKTNAMQRSSLMPAELKPRFVRARAPGGDLLRRRATDTGGSAVIGATDRAIGIVGWFTACFADGKGPSGGSSIILDLDATDDPVQSRLSLRTCARRPSAPSPVNSPQPKQRAWPGTNPRAASPTCSGHDEGWGRECRVTVKAEHLPQSALRHDLATGDQHAYVLPPDRTLRQSASAHEEALDGVQPGARGRE
jgi:hypothetical protein